ncbi:MAG TPA: lipocalin family protein [bacterium]|nr:lipocalin family protein [bacterium]
MRFSPLPGWLVCAAGLHLGSAPAPASDDRPVIAVDSVDLERYAGLWYEIAKVPNRFQDQCVSGTTARYALREDGRIDVLNRCVEEDGGLDEAEGVAKVVDSSGAKLKVSFVSFLGWRPFWGDYWVIGLDDEYRWAIVGTPDRNYGWVLARTPSLPPEALDGILTVLERNGYRRDAFEMSPQD